MKPGTSRRTTTGTLPSCSIQSTSASVVASAVASAPTTSTSSTSSGGFSQCRPAKRSGRRSAAASGASGSDEVLVVRIASGAASSSARTSSSRFGSSSSTIVSTTSSAPARASSADVVSRTRAPFSPSRGRAASRLDSRRAQSRTEAPASAKTRAIPAPIAPAPITATSAGSLTGASVQPCLARRGSCIWYQVALVSAPAPRRREAECHADPPRTSGRLRRRRRRASRRRVGGIPRRERHDSHADQPRGRHAARGAGPSFTLEVDVPTRGVRESLQIDPHAHANVTLSLRDGLWSRGSRSKSGSCREEAPAQLHSPAAPPPSQQEESA